MALTTLEQRSGRLPAELTSFVGRREELAEVGRLLERCRLVTLMGPGGVGKTRLAVHAAARARDRMPDGVCFVDLAAVRGPGLLPLAVAEALGLPDQVPGALLDTLVAHLADRRMLLVLDTCEHLVDGCAILAEALLRSAPGLRVLATSRQPLDVAGEHTLMVAPLPCADPATATGVAAAPCDSTLLFADRAAAVVPGWRVTDANRDAVAALCHRLDGIPLAIELAAVQLRALSVEETLQRLDSRILRIRGRRTTMSRHQTLRAAIEWSHELCTPGERLLWARLSVFAGDFDLATAEHVCCDADTTDAADRPGDGALPAAEVFDVLAGLVAKSVVLRVERDGATRYRMLDTLREYGAERLAELGDAERVRARAYGRFAALVRRAAGALATGEQAEWLDWAHREQANLRAQCEFALRHHSDDQMTRAALGMGRILTLQGLIGEARHWADRLLAERGPEPGPAGTELLALSAWLAAVQNDLAVSRTLVDQAEERAHATGDTRALGYTHQVRGTIAVYSGHPEEAIGLLTEARRLHQAAGTADVLVPIGEVFLAQACLAAGDVPAALGHSAATAAAMGEAGEQWCRSYALCVHGLALLTTGDTDGAARDLRAALRVKRDLRDRLGIALALDLLGAAMIADGDGAGGARLLGAAERCRSATGMGLFGPHHGMLRELVTGQARDLLGERGFEAACRDGRALDLDDAVAEALGECPGRSAPAVLNGAAGPSLTPRELQIAELVADGLTNREIADRLVIAKRTADSHVEHILAKLRFSSRSQIAEWFAGRTG
ncbi:ATP-binding protein [Actinomadura kijaniata]|uniref:ATP-binding protein n=1 Tax=Actinomadura kijaniata TaxID=46161 RepID=UPI003F1C4951